MANVLDYLKWRGDISFNNAEFNEIDGIVLTSIAYLPFEEIKDICINNTKLLDALLLLNNIPDIKEKTMFKEDSSLINLLLKSERFSALELIDFTNIIDNNTESQFCALTFKIEKGKYVIVYRGTDCTLIGWKENFNMTYLCPVPAQVMAVSYFEAIIKSNKGEYIICGHSKGGNLATYACSFAKERYKRKVQKIYCYDSPGFDEQIASSDDYKNICDKISLYIPKTSIVGLLLLHNESYKVVRCSKSVGPLQHDTYTWDVSRTSFIYENKLSDGSIKIDKTLKLWTDTLNKDERAVLFDTIFEILSKTQATTTKELAKNIFLNSKIVLNSINNLDKKTKKAVIDALKIIVECTIISFGK